MTLTEFLLACIDEDAAVAQAARDAHRSYSGGSGDDAYSEMLDLAATFDPARVLAECQAKRRIVEAAAEAQTEASSRWGYVGLDEPGDTYEARVIAAVYADRPGYDEAWRLA